MNTTTSPYTFEPGTPVYALVPHGGLLRRAIRAGHPGEVFATRPSGKVTVEWANGKTTTVPSGWITTDTRQIRADVDPHFAALILNALDHVDPTPLRANLGTTDWEGGWEAGWRSAMEAVHESLVAEGLIPEED